MTQKLEEKSRAGSHTANQENVAELKKGRAVLGELYPILVDNDGKIIDGHHRSSAGFSEKKVLKWVKSPRDKILARIWSNYRREVTESETKTQIIELAKSLEKDGIEKESIASEVAKLVPYSERHVRRLLPEEYKRTYVRIENKEKEHAKLVSHPDVSEHTDPPQPSPTLTEPHSAVMDKLESLEVPDALDIFKQAHIKPQTFDEATKKLPPIRAAKPLSYVYHVDVKNEQVKVKVTIASGYSIPKDALEVEILA